MIEFILGGVVFFFVALFFLMVISVGKDLIVWGRDKLLDMVFGPEEVKDEQDIEG